MAGLIEGDGYFSRKIELTIGFHRKNRIAIKNIIAALKAGVISDSQTQQCSKLRFTGKDLEKVIQLINIGWTKVTQ